jgi:DNA topoisomerase-3
VNEGFRLIVAEKPSVARDIARVLGVKGRGQGVIGSGDTLITWCVGHLIELAEPKQYDDAWAAWRLDTLPMLPETFVLQPRGDARDQWLVLQRLMQEKTLGQVINACDAGREGELIFTYVYEHARCRAPVERLWISSMTDTAILGGFDKLRPGVEMAPLADAARCRSEADWLVGLNATRAMTTRMRTGGRESTLLSVGRVQTPTLALIDTREFEIENFVPEDFFQVKVTFGARDGEWETLWTKPKEAGKNRGEDRTSDKSEAEAVIARLLTDEGARKDGLVKKVVRKKQKEAPPLLYDLTSLQKECNKRFGFSAQQTLEHAQALYERHKVLTYPRTDSRHLTSDQEPDLKPLAASLGFGPYAAASQQVVENWPKKLGKRIIDNSEVSDHHAIIPTGQDPRSLGLSVAEKRLFDLVARRYLAVFHPDAVFATAFVDTVVGDDHFEARGRTCLDSGWRAIDPPFSKKKEVLLPPVEVDDVATQVSSKLHQGQTRPPKRYNEATLLAAMESAGEQLDDAELKRAMKRNGLGTPATRAAVIETLIRRKYIAREQKNLLPTPQGRNLLAALPVPALRSAKLTGEWEARLVEMAEGHHSREVFMRDIREFTQVMVDAVRGSEVSDELQSQFAAPPPKGDVIGECPLCGADVRTGDRTWGCVKCPLRIGQQIARRPISDRMVKTLLKDRRAGPVKGFKARSGKTFTAALVIDDTGKVTFDFPDPDPLGACPQCQQPVRQRGQYYTCDTGRSCPFIMGAEMSGRPVTDDEVRTLLATGTTARLEGFERDGESFGAALRWQGGRVTIVPIDIRAVSGSAGACPDCRADVLFDRGNWMCKGCRFRIAGELGGRAFQPDEVTALLTHGRTQRVPGFRQKNGSVFKAAVVLEAGGRLKWDFNKPEPAPIPPGAPQPAFGKRTDCPACVQRAEPDRGYLIAGRSAWGCSRWKAGCAMRVPFTIEGWELPTDQAKRLFSGHGATRWEKGLGGAKKGRIVLHPDKNPCFELEQP